MDKVEERNEKKDKIAGKVMDRIKHLKKTVKKNVRAKMNEQLILAEKEAQGEDVDPESRMSPQEMLMMLG